MKSQAKIEYLDKSYNPQLIQDKLKDLAKQRQQAAENMSPENFSAGKQ